MMPARPFGTTALWCCRMILRREISSVPTTRNRAVRPSIDVFNQFAELEVNLISLPIETTNETLMQSITCTKKKLELKVGVWA